MVAVSFGGYATSLFVGDDAASWWDNVFITRAHGRDGGGQHGRDDRRSQRRQSLIVIGVLAVFARLHRRDDRRTSTSTSSPFSGYPSFSKIIASVALTFFAYLGFNVITFTAGDLKNPARDLPRAMYRALGITSSSTS